MGPHVLPLAPISSTCSLAGLAPSMAPKGRPAGSVRDRAAWAEVLADFAEHAARADAGDRDEPGAAIDHRAALERARAVKRELQDGRCPGVATEASAPKRGRGGRSWYTPGHLETLSSGRATKVPFVPCSLLGDFDRMLLAMPGEGVAAPDEELRTVAKDMLWGRGRQRSATARAEDCGVQRFLLGEHERSLAAALHCCDLSARASLETKMAGSPSQYELVFYVDYERYDEATMPVTTERVAPASANRSSVPSGSELAKPIRTLMSQVALGEPRGKEQGTTKIVQSLQTYGMLVKRKPGPGDEQGGQYFCILGDSFTNLQACDRTTGEVLKFLIQQRSACSLGAKAFSGKARLVTVDHYAANFKAERSLKRDLGWLSLVVGCEAHTIANLHSKTMQLIDQDITGALHLALAVEMAGMMSKFRASLTEVIAQRLTWPPLRGTPSHAAAQHRLRCIQALTIGWTRSSTQQRRALLCLLPLGDWRLRDRVEAYANDVADGLPEKETFVANIASSLTQGLAWHKLAKYPRSRWLGCEAAIAQPALLDACHGLLRPAFELFCKKLGAKVAVSASGVRNCSTPGVQRMRFR